MADEKKKLEPITPIDSSADQSDTKLQDLDHWAKIILNDHEYNEVHKLLFKEKAKKESKPKYSEDNWWKRQLENEGSRVDGEKAVRINKQKSQRQQQDLYRKKKINEDIDSAIDLINEILEKYEQK